VKAGAFAADLVDPAAARAVVGKAREALGRIHAIHWNAYNTGAGNLLTATPEEEKERNANEPRPSVHRRSLVALSACGDVFELVRHSSFQRSFPFASTTYGGVQLALRFGAVGGAGDPGAAIFGEVGGELAVERGGGAGSARFGSYGFGRTAGAGAL
jgi:NAD(P)-dependent dehydrogenase (short-subunit alcohol dehydrogenase family)